MEARKGRSQFIGFLAIVGALLIAPAAARAGQNTWTGSQPPGGFGSAQLIASSGDDPDVVYAVFQPNLYRSADGGRTWTPIRRFSYGVLALLVHPAEPSTVYVSGDFSAVVSRSTDGGQTWTNLGIPATGDYVTALAGSPSDASTVLAGTAAAAIYKTTDRGATWSGGVSPNLSGEIARLVIDPNSDRNVYTGTDADYYYFQFGAFARSSDGGATWSSQTPGSFDEVKALAIEPATSTLYMSLFSYFQTKLNGFYRSTDGGMGWTRLDTNLPDHGVVSSIVTDRGAFGLLYAGTSAGVYQSLDGNDWSLFNPTGLGGLAVRSLVSSGYGQFLHAATDAGEYDFEFVHGPIDVATGPSDSRVMVWESNRLSVSTLDASAQWMGTPSGDASTTWTAVAIAEGSDGLARVLWQCIDGRSGVEVVGPSGRVANSVFQALPHFAPADVTVGADGATRILWVGTNGQMFLSVVDASGNLSLQHGYGPAPGWSAVAIAAGAEGTWVLWRCSDGRAGLSLHGADGVMLRSFQWAASPAGFAAEDIAVGADGRPRLLRTGPGLQAEIWTVDAAGQLSAGQTYSDFGYTPRRISAGADGLTRLLWNYAAGQGHLWLLNADNTVASRHDTPDQ